MTWILLRNYLHGTIQLHSPNIGHYGSAKQLTIDYSLRLPDLTNNHVSYVIHKNAINLPRLSSGLVFSLDYFTVGEALLRLCKHYARKELCFNYTSMYRFMVLAMLFPSTIAEIPLLRSHTGVEGKSDTDLVLVLTKLTCLQFWLPWGFLFCLSCSQIYP